MKTFDDEAEAVQYMRAVNKTRSLMGKPDILVLVYGPGDSECTIMDISEAVEGDFNYYWEI